MIKLCIISTVPSTILTFFGDQLGYLQKNGFEVTVITSPLEPSQNFGNKFSEGVKFYAVKMSRTINPLDDCKAFWQMLRIIKKGRFDIVQYVTPKASLLGSLAAWRCKVPVRLYLMWGLYYVTLHGFRRFLFRSFERIVCACSTAIAPDSKGNVQFALQEGLCTPDKIGVVGAGSANGVDVERFDPVRLAPFRTVIRTRHNIPQEAFVFGTIAAIVGDKGVNELIAAFADIAKAHPQAYLLYVGQTTEKDPVRPETLRQIETHERIIHVGWQTEPEKYMAAMDVFVLPTYREGFGVVNIEASAMGLPVISTDVPGPQESIVHGETGILVPAMQVEPLAEAMQEIMRQPVLAKKLGEAGRRRVADCYEQKTLWKEIVKHKLQLLKQAGVPVPQGVTL
jgi:glycosyltransferase involved in cell wall biosynthesis